MSDQGLKVTLSEVICYAFNRVTSSDTKDKDALIQEYREWLSCIGKPELIPTDVLVINTLTFKDAYLNNRS